MRERNFNMNRNTIRGRNPRDMPTINENDDVNQPSVELANFDEAEELLLLATPDLDSLINDAHESDLNQSIPTENQKMSNAINTSYIGQKQSTKSILQTSTPIYQKYAIETIELVAQSHDSQLRKVTECIQHQATLLNELNSLYSNKKYGQMKKDQGFEKYLFELDEVFEQKLVVIEDLKELVEKILSNGNKIRI